MFIPTEVTLRILTHLEPYECKCMIRKLLPLRNTEWISSLISLLVYRLYNEKLVVMMVENMIPSYNKEVTVLSLSTFIDNVLDSGFENRLFQRSNPNYLKFLFSRRIDEYCQFSKALNRFSSILDDDTDEVHQFIQRSQAISYEVCGRLFMVENPSSVSVMTIRSLVSLTNTHFRDKLVTIKISSTEIGEFFGMQWAQLFKKFVNLKELEISSSLVLTGAIDLLQTHLETPPNLQTLIMENNNIYSISVGFLEKLPCTLTTLSFADSCLREFAAGMVGPLSRILPNLKSLDLHANQELYFLSSKLFEGYGSDFSLNLKNINLEPNCRESIRSVSKRTGFSVYF